jgi:hypothetical protein
MDDALANQTRMKLDAELSRFSHGVVISFGATLWHEFFRRGWITKELFGAEGTKLFATAVPAYDRIHLAVFNSFLHDTEYKVGGRLFHA